MTEITDRNPWEHIPEEDLAAFLAKRLSPERNEEVIAHLAECSLCRTVIVQSERSQDEASE